MELVINIDNETYSAIKSLIELNTEKRNFKGIIGKCFNAVKNGVVLPKGHGRLIDADKLFIDERKRFSKFPDSISVSYARIFSEIDKAPPVIEADQAYQKKDNNLPLCEDVIHGDFMGVMDKE